MKASFGITTAAVLLGLLTVQTAQAKMCPQIEDPVCGLDANRQHVTYPNRCQARNAGATVLHKGACYGPICPFFIINGGVCGKSAITGEIKTYGNVCLAEQASAIVISNKPCPGQ